ncbi:hypothetical protein JB92DRAFT_2823515 [Gautieria morchelliformis]|nr:hypothetical protein JB92DRAFT_2823515 [Gautieria morchelliformis]
MDGKPEDISPPRTNSQKTSWAPPYARDDPQPAADSQQPFSASFWSRDGHTASVRKKYLTTLARGTLLTAIAILAILSIYWGALWKVGDGIHNLNGWIVDFDGGAIGHVVRSVAVDMTGPKDAISWSVIPSSGFVSGPSDVVQAVLDEKCWVAIVVNPQATAKLNAAVSTVDATYNSSSAVTVYTVEARNENAYPAFIAPQPQVLMNVAAKVFADQHATQLASNPNAMTLLSRAPGVVTRPLYYTLDNLRPFDVFATSAADFVGLIYLLIISYLIANLNFGARLEGGLARHLTLRSLIQVRIFSPIIMYCFLSLIFALLSRAFQIPFDRVFHGGFAIFWILCWVAMSAVGLVLEAVVTILTPRFTPYFMILWIIVNVSVCFYPIEVLPQIYRYGYGTPFYNVSRATRTIVFDTRNQIGLNFGVEFAWIAVSLITLPLFQWYKRRGDVRTWQAQRQGADRMS